MQATLRAPGRARRAVGYALNVFSYRTLAELRMCLETDVLRLKAAVFPRESFPIELRFSEHIVAELQNAPDEILRLKNFLDDHDLALITINGFVMPVFHGEPVKEHVYLPAWHESDARLDFTNACLDLLARLAPGTNSSILSVSVPFGALKPVPMSAVAPNILRAAEYAASLKRHCVVALEPEPGLCVETTAEVIEFFERYVPAKLRPHLGVNFDLSHQLVQFEDLAESIALLQCHNVLIAKIHVSNAAELTEWKSFYDDSIYLHQVCGVDTEGQKTYFSLDWPTVPPPPSLRKFRVHYHLPVFPTPAGSTLTEVERFLATTLPSISATVPAIIETYTWPEQLSGHGSLVENIVKELNWVRQKISLSESQPRL